MQHGHTPQQIWLGRRGAGIGESDRPQMMLHAGHVRRVMSGIRVLGKAGVPATRHRTKTAQL